MCGRFTITMSADDVHEQLELGELPRDWQPRYNVAPTQPVAAVTDAHSRQVEWLRWGLIPYWAKDIKIGYKLINARIEGIEEKPSFRQAFHKRRCIVPFDGYYEWQKTQEGKIPYRIQLKNTEIFTIAGLYEHWKDPKGEVIHSFTLITHDADPVIRHLHDRQPLVLLPEQEKLWLDPDIPSKDLIHELDPVPGEYFTWYRVSDRVNNVRENDEGLIEAV